MLLFIMINITLITFSLDKLEKRDEMMLKTQEKLLKKLDDANQIEIQKIDLFSKKFMTSTHNVPIVSIF